MCHFVDYCISHDPETLRSYLFVHEEFIFDSPKFAFGTSAAYFRTLTKRQLTSSGWNSDSKKIRKEFDICSTLLTFARMKSHLWQKGQQPIGNALKQTLNIGIPAGMVVNRSEVEKLFDHTTRGSNFREPANGSLISHRLRLAAIRNALHA